MQSNYFLGHLYYREMPVHDNVMQIAKGYGQTLGTTDENKHAVNIVPLIWIIIQPTMMH